MRVFACSKQRYSVRFSVKVFRLLKYREVIKELFAIKHYKVKAGEKEKKAILLFIKTLNKVAYY